MTERAQTTDAMDHSRLKILILDDNDFDRQNLKRMMSRMDDQLEAIMCSSFAEFQDELSQERIDLCLIDHHLADVTGLEVVKAIKSSAALANIPVVMISGTEDIQTIVQSMNAGCTDYLSKHNLTAESLHHTIHSAIAAAFTGPEFAEQVRQSSSNVMRAIADDCVGELKPKLRRMYRHVSFIRSCHAQSVFPSPDALDDVEEQCLTIWRFFDEVETYSQGLSKTRH